MLSGLDFNFSGIRVAPELQESFAAVIPGGLPVAPSFDESFWQFLPTFFTEPTRFSWAHLWFLAYLSTFTLLYLPVFLWPSRRRGQPSCTSTLVAYSPVVPLVMIQLVLRPLWPGRMNLCNDWANFAYYSTFMVVGFLLARYPVLEQTVHREWKRALLIGLGTTLVLLLGVMGVFDSERVLLAGSAVAGWCFVVGMLGFARVFFTFSNRLHRYLTESALPVYLLHQSAIVLPGYFLVQLQLGMATKYGMLLFTSVIITLVVYHFGVRPFSVPRFLCGLRPLPDGRGRTLTAMEGRARPSAST